MTPFDLNCDLGEGEPRAVTAALMSCISSANVACGGHAGTSESMQWCVRLAREHGCWLGAHPGLPGDFGRRNTPVTPAELRELILDQVGSLQSTATDAGVELHHIKLHGALYHAADADPDLAAAYLGLVAQRWPGVKVYARAGGTVAARAAQFDVAVRPEAFLDRSYRADGTLVPRSTAGALILDPHAIQTRIRELQTAGIIRAEDGTPLSLSPTTLCVHGDSPESTALVRLAALELGLPRHPGKLSPAPPAS